MRHSVPIQIWLAVTIPEAVTLPVTFALPVTPSPCELIAPDVLRLLAETVVAEIAFVVTEFAETAPVVVSPVAEIPAVEVIAPE